LFARYGGEEFVLVTAHNAVEAKAFAEMLRQHIEEAKLAHLGRKVKQVTASFGVRTYTNETTADELVNKADELLYLAKASGRNCVQA
jgi:diguanylate cyclase (GGDEF)-like protein